MTSIDLSTLPKVLQDLMVRAKPWRLKFLLVGGSVRDYLMAQINNHPPFWSHDCDLEVRWAGSAPLHQDEWQECLKSFVQSLWDAYEVEELPFMVWRIKPKGESYSLEMASPRREIYKKGQQSFGHSDFEVETSHDLPLEAAFERRDFTINALAIDLQSGKLLDPLGGLEDLKNNILKTCGENFYRDPVRFLRAIRFKIRFAMEFHPSLEKQMALCDLSSLSQYYVDYEAKKTGYLPFFKSLFEFDLKKLKAPLALMELNFISTLNTLEQVKVYHLKNVLEVIVFNNEIDSETLVSKLHLFCQYFKISPTLLNKLLQFKADYKKILAFWPLDRLKKITLKDWLDHASSRPMVRFYNFVLESIKNEADLDFNLWADVGQKSRELLDLTGGQALKIQGHFPQEIADKDRQAYLFFQLLFR